MYEQHASDHLLVDRLPSSVSETIKNKLSLILLRTCQDTYNRKDQARRTKVPEAEARLDWDILVNEFTKNDQFVKFR
jgi:hypothetical protein